MTVFNVDEYLKENEIEVVLNKKTFLIKDVAPETLELLKDENVDQKQWFRRFWDASLMFLLVMA